MIKIAEKNQDRGSTMNIHLNVYVKPTTSPDLWTLFDSDGRVLLTDTFEEISRAVLYLQARLAFDGIVQREIER
jgi:hypothetical protein